MPVWKHTIGSVERGMALKKIEIVYKAHVERRTGGQQPGIDTKNPAKTFSSTSHGESQSWD